MPHRPRLTRPVASLCRPVPTCDRGLWPRCACGLRSALWPVARCIWKSKRVINSMTYPSIRPYQGRIHTPISTNSRKASTNDSPDRRRTSTDNRRKVVCPWPAYASKHFPTHIQIQGVNVPLISTNVSSSSTDRLSQATNCTW